MKTEKEKPRIAFFDFACCEGCQLTVLQLEETLLDLLDHVEVVAWREAMSGGSDDYDIAFCEGSIAGPEDMARIHRIRETAETVVSLGTCASIGCHNALRNAWSTKEVLELVYGDQWDQFKAVRVQPVASVISVDYRILGCPASLSEIKTVFKRILTGQPHPLSNDPVCVECKRKDNLCVLEKGLICLGPVTRCGCDAICTTYGDACQGCRGLVDEPHLMAMVRMFERGQRHAIMEAVARRIQPDRDQIRSWFSLYNGPDLPL
ncbi:MAG: NADH:ubiquinone oxidoreductase [Desulfobulbaceae bacterium]|nr:NADH:ubiquinone oxidoreductase [Desulfobulbaceae bacterium]